MRSGLLKTTFIKKKKNTKKNAIVGRDYGFNSRSPARKKKTNATTSENAGCVETTLADTGLRGRTSVPNARKLSLWWQALPAAKSNKTSERPSP